jgi:hypothetical protein
MAKLAKLKEVTVEDIEQKYVQEVFEKKLVDAINMINGLLESEFESVVERERLRIQFSNLNIGSFTADQRENLVDHINDFYTTWSVFLQGIGGVMYVQIEPDADFDITTDVTLLKVARQELQESSDNNDESVDNRADILDL